MKFSAVGFTKNEIKFILDVLGNKKAWDASFSYSSTPSKELVIIKTPGADIDKTFGAQKYLHGLSVCDRTKAPTIIYFRKENWDSIPVTSGYNDLALYRVYLILHEFGHAIGYDHAKCPGAGQPAPVMMQQTLGTGKCYPDPWVVK